MRKNHLSVLFMLLVACALISLMGCEGEEGPTGAAGADGTASCGTCHDVTTSVLGKQTQWASSAHATGDSWARGSSASCAPCHSSEGFTMAAAGEEIVAPAAPTTANCRTCHNIHLNYDETDYALTTTAAVTLVGDLSDNATFDIGKGNLCANCHQTRSRGYGLDTASTSDVEINSSHWGPHHGVQANNLIGVGAFEVSGSMAYANSPHATMVEDGCVTCHVYNDNHTFESDDDACVTCHGEDFDYEEIQTEIAGLYEELNQALVAAGVLAGDAEEGYHPVSGVTTNMVTAGALFNARIMADEGSLGVHNYKYTKAMLTNSIEALQ